MNELFNCVSKAKIYTKIDYKDGFNLIRIAAGQEHKTAFWTRYGSYEYLIMPFGLTNVLWTLQTDMDMVLGGHIDRGVVVYIDDILIYSDNEEEHIATVQEVLGRVLKGRLAADTDKCYFHVPKVAFLFYILGEEGMSMD